jgi:hypothetical protein
MTVTVDPAVDVISDPAGTARDIALINDTLAADAVISGEIVESVYAIASSVGATRTDPRWEAVDPYLQIVVQGSAVQAQDALRHPEERHARDQLRIALESMRQGFAAIAENEPVGDDRSPKEIARWLADTAEVPQSRLAELLGVSLRQFQRWISPQGKSEPEGDEARRLRAVARILNQLRFSLTPAGAVEWFTWPHDRLDGRRPLDVLNEPDALPDLTAIAGSMRSTYLI